LECLLILTADGGVIGKFVVYCVENIRWPRHASYWVRRLILVKVHDFQFIDFVSMHQALLGHARNLFIIADDSLSERLYAFCADLTQ
jgi:hypothetical protein